MGKWKAVRHGLNQPIELYDLKPISVSSDLAAHYPKVVQRIKEILHASTLKNSIHTEPHTRTFLSKADKFDGKIICLKNDDWVC